MGRDYFMRCVYGARISLSVGFFAMLTSLFIGTTLGLAAGYYGNIIDEILMRFIDFISAIPALILITAVGMFIKKGIISIVLIIGMFSWMGIARIIRAEVLSLRQRDYVKYAKHIGEKKYYYFNKTYFTSSYAFDNFYGNNRNSGKHYGRKRFKLFRIRNSSSNIKLGFFNK